MECSECARLLAECDRLNAVHAEAFRAVLRGRFPPDAYRRVWAAVNKAWTDSELALVEFQQHQWSHTRTFEAATGR
jgi:hypothetical protein